MLMANIKTILCQHLQLINDAIKLNMMRFMTKYTIVFCAFFLLCGVSFAQSTNTDQYIKSAKKALDEGDYVKAMKLAHVYNDVTGTSLGEGIIKTAQVHITCDSLHNIAKEQIILQQFEPALRNFVTAYNLFPSDSSSFPFIEKCSDAIINNKVEVSPSSKMAENLYDIYVADTAETNQRISILLVAALYGNGRAAKCAGKYFMDNKQYDFAIQYYEMAKKQNEDVSNNLGCCYSNFADSQDWQTKNRYLKFAYEFFLEAANDGNEVGQYNVGICLLNGKGVQKDLNVAKEWLQKSYDNGYDKARYKLDEVDKMIQQANISKSSTTPPPPKFRPFDPEECINEYQIGIGYKYSRDFPLTISGNFHSDNLACHYIVLGTEVGVNFDKQLYERNNVETKEGSVIETKDIYNPHWYLMFSAGVNLRIVSLHFGVGGLFLGNNHSQKTSTQSLIEITSSIAGESNTETIPAISSLELKYNTFGFGLVMQPSVAFNIPICYDDYYISINLGYNFIPKFKELNGFSCGVSFSF